MEVVKELKQHIGGFTGRSMYLWDSIADLGYSTDLASENMVIVYDPDDKPVARIEIKHTDDDDGIKVVSIFN